MTEKHDNMMLFCNACQEVYAIPARRGRPPGFCNTCGNDPVIVEKFRTAQRLTKQQERLDKAKARVDRLEMLLRSRGEHPSQQKER